MVVAIMSAPSEIAVTETEYDGALVERGPTDPRPLGSGEIITVRRLNRRRRRNRRWRHRTGGVLALILAGLVTVFALDMWSSRDRVVRGVELDGIAVGGFDEVELENQLSLLDPRFDALTVELTTPEGPLMTDAAGLGLALDRTATLDAAFAIGRSEGPIGRVVGWIRRWSDPASVPLAVEVPDAADLQRAVAGLGAPLLWPAQEPHARLDGSRLVVVPAVVGRSLAIDELRSALPVETRGLPESIVRAAALVDVPTITDDTSLQASVDTVNELTAQGVRVVLQGDERVISPAVLRSWFQGESNGAGAGLEGDPDRVERHLRHLYADMAELGDDARFDLVAGTVQVQPTQNLGQRCCAEGSGVKILRALTEGQGEVVLTMRPYPSTRDAAWARSLGVTEVVGEFTTRHAAGQSRVTNIHRIADLVRGQVIEPGGTFSVNDFVGRRSRADGFVGAGVIYEGRFAQDVGGGISQFATTLFNAAFFAGLDFGEYQSHSLYISRYPYGREATLSFPHPDLQIVNTTPYGVLIWPTYTSSSITIELFSTKSMEVEDTGSTRSRRGACTLVTTERTRRGPDGATEIDEVHALYRPGQGVGCGGPFPPSWPGMPGALDPVPTVTP